MNEFMVELYKASLRKRDERKSFILIKQDSGYEKTWQIMNPIIIDIWKGLGYADETIQVREDNNHLFDELKEELFNNYSSFKENEQDDGTSLLIEIINAMEFELGNCFKGGIDGMKAYHHCMETTYNRCKICNYSHTESVTQLFINLSFEETATNMFTLKELITINTTATRFPLCKSHDGGGMKTVSFTGSPKYIFFTLNIFKFSTKFSNIEKIISFKIDLQPIYITEYMEYDLILVMSHIGDNIHLERGTDVRGNYVMYRKIMETWYLFNDEMVTKVNLEKIGDTFRNETIYLLCYERRQLFCTVIYFFTP